MNKEKLGKNAIFLIAPFNYDIENEIARDEIIS